MMDTTKSANSSSHFQKKVLTYARDIALDKLNKKLDKKIAQQQIRKKEREDILYSRCSQNSDFVPSSSSDCSSSSTDVVQSNARLTTDAKELENRGVTKSLLNKSVGQSVGSIDSAGQEEEYETADEDEPLPTKKDVEPTLQKPGELNEIPKSNDVIVEITDDKNDKLMLQHTLPPDQPHSPHHHHHHSSGSSVDYSGYIQKKSLAQGMMDLALVSANTNQLRYIIEYKEHHPYFMTSVSLVIASLFLQLAVGMTLIWNTRFNVKKRKEMQEADKVNNFSVIGIFIVTLINVFLSTFGGAPQSGGLTGSKTETVVLPDETINPADDPIILH